VTPPPAAQSPAPTTTTPSAKAPSATAPPAGGSEPARTELALTATRRGITPAHAGVAPYVSVRVTLTSADGSAHTLSIGGRTMKVGPGVKRATATLAGLRPGRSYSGRSESGQTVRILSTSEPGP
jgi:hypothetical protein